LLQERERRPERKRFHWTDLQEMKWATQAAARVKTSAWCDRYLQLNQHRIAKQIFAYPDAQGAGTSQSFARFNSKNFAASLKT